MDAFWGPTIIYASIIGVGFLVAAIGAGLADEKQHKQIGGVIAMLGVSIMGVAAVPLAAKFIGTLIEKLF